MTQVTNSREAGAEGMQHVWVVRASRSDDTRDPVVCATRDIAMSRAAAEANGADPVWEDNGHGISISKVGGDVLTIFETPVHQF